MPYQVIGGPTKDKEYELYVEALRACGHEPEPDAKGRIGVVDSRSDANLILAAVQERVRYVDWRVIVIDD